MHMITTVGSSGKASKLAHITDLPTKPSGIILIESITHAEIKELASHCHLDHGNLCDALDINEVPRLEYRDDYDYLYLRLPTGSHDIAQVTQPVLLVYNKAALFLITGNKCPITADDSLLKDLAVMPSVTSALVYLLARAVDTFDRQIKIQTDAIHNIVIKMQKHKLQNEDSISFIMIEEQINSFVSALTPLVPLFNRLQSDRNLRMTTATNDMLTDVILATQQSINICNANAKRITSIGNAYTTLSNDSLNRIMKTLTIATLLIAAPNLVFSMYGMNVKLPMQWEDTAFIVTLILAIAIVILVIIWGKKRRLF